MTSDPGFSGFALHLSPDGITLHGTRGHGDWTALARVPVNPETIHGDLRRMRLEAARGRRGALPVEVWLPEEEVAIRAIDSGDVAPVPAMIAHAFRDAAPRGAADLVLDAPGVQLGGVHVMAGVRRTVLEDAMQFLAPHGFAATGFTLAASPEGLDHTPWFPPPGAEQARPRWRISWPWKGFGAAGIAVAMAAVLLSAAPAMARLPGAENDAHRTAGAEALAGAVRIAQLTTAPRPLPRSPIDAVPPAALAPERTAAPVAAAAPDGSVRVIPARPDTVPPLRPVASVASSVPELAAQANADLAASANALTRSDRPLRRPATASVAAELEVAALEPSANALTRSDRPLARPAAAAAAPAPQAAPVTSVAPDPQSAPAQPAARRDSPPRIPTSASVAAAATVEDAIPLRQVVLVGVYGKTGSRSALVRLSSGRYQKVRPGDTVEGSEVAAISEDAIRLRRGGRDTVLVIPQ
ncbi:hypothetical protein HMH01_05880 [Halovulum dunhuangense]|uniref:Type IV pilus biogenesis protein PilP n=1 Tax=Halovulum dunhuangense TaxID=1505036 RepID=A0A849L144_9RHOB|nr:hypothetical protein [Halovulum dunhuangense]NNU79965.1 hypothetical protein [Halovulum dunhuangense]